MNFLIFAGISAVVLMIAPVYLAKHFGARWKMPKGIFLKAGVALFFIEVFHAAVIGNATSIWPQIFDFPLWLRSVILGVVAALFFELGRFVTLDRVMKHVRSYKETTFFGMGWSGVESFLLGVLLLLWVFTLSTFPPETWTSLTDLSPEQAQSVAVVQDLLQSHPVLALAQILERASMMMIDIALSLLIVFALIKGQMKYVWIAVGLRAVFMATLLYVGTVNLPAGEIVFAAGGIGAYFLIVEMKKRYPAHLAK